VAFFTFTNFHPTKHLRDRNRLTICSADGTERWVAVEEIKNKAETMFAAPRLIWSQDGSMLYLIHSEDPWGQAPVRIWTIDVAGRKLTDLGTAGKEWNYYLMRVALAADGKSVVLGSSDHRMHQVDKEHSQVIIIVAPNGKQSKTQNTFKDVLTSPGARRTLGICQQEFALFDISPDATARKFFAYGQGKFVMRLFFSGETGEVLLVTGPQDDRRAWMSANGGKTVSPLYDAVLIDSAGRAATVIEKALPDAAVPLPQKDTVLVTGAEKPYIIRPFANRKEELDGVPSNALAMPSPDAGSPWVFLQGKDGFWLLNWKTKKSVRLEGKPLANLQLPVSWSADGKTVAFCGAKAENLTVAIPKLVEQPVQFGAGEIWTLRLAQEDKK
jgi:hypothetical protein